MHCSIYQLEAYSINYSFFSEHYLLDVTRLAVGVLLISLEQYAGDGEVRVYVSFIVARFLLILSMFYIPVK